MCFCVPIIPHNENKFDPSEKNLKNTQEIVLKQYYFYYNKKLYNVRVKIVSTSILFSVQC